MSDAKLTTRQAAELLKVHESTVKRWCNADELPYEKTQGGHRRIRLRKLMDFARSQGMDSALLDFTPFENEVWHATEQALNRNDFGPATKLALDWCLGDEPYLLESLFQYLGSQPQVSVGGMFDGLVGSLMTAIGERWRDGRIGVGDEHFTTQMVLDAMHRLRAAMLGRRSPFQPRPWAEEAAPVAVVACAEGELHELGALAVRMVLEQHHWHVYYLGANVPVEEVAAFQKKHAARLVAVSYVPPRAPSDGVRTVRLLAQMYDTGTPYSLVLGGAGVEGAELPRQAEPFEALTRFHSIAEFEAWLVAKAGGEDGSWPQQSVS